MRSGNKILTGKSILSLSLSLSLILLAFSALALHGKPVTVIGTTSPDALVTVHIPKLTLSQPVLADEEGFFIVTFNDIPPGVYELFLSLMKDGSSNEKSQLIGIPDPPAVTQVTISEINLPLAPVKSIKKEKTDLNGDGKVDLGDVALLLANWTN